RIQCQKPLLHESFHFWRDYVQKSDSIVSSDEEDEEVVVEKQLFSTSKSKRRVSFQEPEEIIRKNSQRSNSKRNSVDAKLSIIRTTMLDTNERINEMVHEGEKAKYGKKGFRI